MRISKHMRTSRDEAVNAITHGGTFHADDVISAVILDTVLGELNLMRTFEVSQKMSEKVIVFDIGGGQFDHHQPGGNGVRENGIPYSSAGLIWAKFGHEYLEAYCPKHIIDLVWQLIDRDLIQGIDAIDCGKMPNLNYPAQAMNLAQMIDDFNPNWDESIDSDECFKKAFEFAEGIFFRMVLKAISKAEAKTIVEEAIEKAEGQIMILDQFVPWQEFIFASENSKAKEILFVIFPSSRGGYNWQCVPDAPGSFGQRKPVPNEWKGLRGEELQEVSGIASAIFCHPAGFIGSAETQADAIKMAEIAVKA